MAKSNNQIIIFDTTLRDGEQSPGASMSLEEKIQIARAFEDLGVDVMEAGFPAASNGDFEAVSEIAKICTFSSRLIEAPGDCSPSLNVVSKIMI